MSIMGLTTKELSSRSGIKEETINSYLKTNGAMPTADKAVKLAEALNTSVEFLVTGFERKSTNNTYEIHSGSRYYNFFSEMEKLPYDSRNSLIRFVESIVHNFTKK